MSLLIDAGRIGRRYASLRASQRHKSMALIRVLRPPKSSLWPVLGERSGPWAARRLAHVILKRFVSEVFGENCYLIASEATRQAIVVDPGVGAASAMSEQLAADGLELGAVLLTHGHSDHVWDAGTLAGLVPVYVSEPDFYRLANPFDIGGASTLQIRDQFPGSYTGPKNLLNLPPELFVGGGGELVPGISLRALAAPGHTEGSTLYFISDRWSAAVEQFAGALPGSNTLVLTGDVLFKNSIGRTDLAGGDPAVMSATLRTLKQVIAPDSMLFPGHGEATTMSAELANNPFLRKDS